MISKSRLGFVLAIVVVFFAGIFLGNFNKQNLPNRNIQTNQTKFIKLNLPNKTYKIKLTKQNQSKPKENQAEQSKT